jgi:uncharacterized surface protein with fasciclin (FAS1) repeats
MGYKELDMVKELVVSKSKITIGVIASVMLAVTALTATASAAKPLGNAGKPGENTIVVISARLVDALSSTKQYTVFAPTDAAFVKSLKVADEVAAIDAVESMNKKELTDILLYHVTEGRRGATSVLAAPQYQMLNRDKLTRTDLTAAGINTNFVNISASNGVVHGINSVLMPN